MFRGYFILDQMDANKGKKWSRENLELLIEAYQDHDCLYNTKSSDYFNRERKRDALEAILAMLKDIRPHTTVAELKYKLKSMRIQFVQERKKIQQSHLYTPKVWWYGLLAFLGDHVDARKSKSNIHESHSTSNLQTKSTPAQTEELYEDVKFVKDSEDILMSPVSVKQEPEQSLSRENSSSRDTTKDRKRSTPQARRIIDNSLQSAAFETSTKQSKLCQHHGENPWRTFGEFVGQSLNGIKSQTLATQMKHDIMKVIMDGEKKDNHKDIV